ncbi:hypothetical protein [Chondromyces crocatus]|uniref:Uncharacterized protein n=1 Tax=Chondromyces crocatus TaxID=52 RepID=A0A0K1E6P9_CHOCO|nr:hypothetical protein [Chondromyces crocatus]AKT36238.1 uncharacterized protein CMC5_003520 [Chondromyces crocatus]
MNLTGKLDLDGLLHEWPAPPQGDDDAEWEKRAARITQAALTRSPMGAEALEVALADPSLEPEPEEPREQSARSNVRQAGETKMSQGSDDRDEGRPSITEGRSSMTSSAPSKKRVSLKEIAERASQSGLAGPPGRNSEAPVSLTGSRGPTSIATPLSSGGSASIPPSLSGLPSRSGSLPPPGRSPGEASGEDSGLINLKAVTDPPPAEKPAKAQPPAADLDFDDGTPQDTADAAKKSQRPAAAPAAEQKKKKSGGVVIGAVIAAVGLAASFAIIKGQSEPPPQPQAVMQPEEQAPQEPAKQAAAQEQPTPVATPEKPSAMDPSQLPEATAPEPDKHAHANPTGTAAPAAAATADTPAAAPGGAALAQAPTAATAAKPAATGKPGDLSSAMQAAVGSDGSQSAPTEAMAPAAGTPLNQTVPEQPPQGSIQAAIRSIMPAAKACVAGADDVSRANVSFSSAGTVSNVSVTGWAASNGQSGCVKSAIQGAKVGPFSKPSFSVGVTIRP